MNKLWKLILSHLKGVFATILVALLSFTLGLYGNNLSGRRQAIQADYDQVIQAENELDTLFTKLMIIAAGEAPKKDEDVMALRTELLALKNSAYNIVLTAPAVGPEYEALKDRMVDLVSAAEALSGDPLEGKQFARAVADYAVASDLFKKAVVGERSRLFAL